MKPGDTVKRQERETPARQSSYTASWHFLIALRTSFLQKLAHNCNHDPSIPRVHSVHLAMMLPHQLNPSLSNAVILTKNGEATLNNDFKGPPNGGRFPAACFVVVGVSAERELVTSVWESSAR
jgi:hypothetical protein